MRKVNDVRPDNEVGLDVVSRPRDTYVRPAAPKKDQLVAIAETLTKINPQLNKYLARKEEEKRNFEEAVGADLYRRYGGRSSAEIKEMVRNGEVEGLRRLTKNHINGIHRLRHKALADSITTHMLSWEDKATIEDENGNKIPLSQVTDENRAMAAFEREQQRYIMEKTGGVYDKTLFDEVVEKRVEVARNTFIQRQGARLAQQKQLEKFTAVGETFEAVGSYYIRDGKLLLNDEATALQFAGHLYDNVQLALAEGVSESEAMDLLAKWFEAKFQNINIDHIDELKEVAMKLPFWDNSDFQAKIMRDAQNSTDARYNRDRNERFAREQEAEAKAYNLIDELAAQYGSYRKVPITQWEAVLREVGSAGAATISRVCGDILRIQSNSGSLATSMDESEFQRLRIKAARGQLSQSELLNLAGYMSDDQHGKLLQANRDSKIGDGTGKSSAGKLFDLGEKYLSSGFGITIDPNASGEEIGKTFKAFAALQEKLRLEIAVALQKNPNMSEVERELMVMNIVGDMTAKYKDDFAAIKENPKLMDKPDAERKVAVYEETAKSKLSVFNQANPTVRRLIVEMNEAAKTGRKFAVSTTDCKEISANGMRSNSALDWKNVKTYMESAYQNMQNYYNANGG